MNDQTKQLIDAYEQQWEEDETAAYRRQPRRYRYSAQRHRKPRRRVALGINGRRHRIALYTVK